MVVVTVVVVRGTVTATDLISSNYNLVMSRKIKVFPYYFRVMHSYLNILI